MKLEVEHILVTLKKNLSLRKITYNDVSKALGMSESGVKKLLNGTDIKLEKLIAICDFFKIPFSDLVKNSESEISIKEFTRKEEDFFLENHDLYFFYLCLERYQFDFHKVIKKMKISKVKGNNYLKSLLELGVVDKRDGDLRGKYEGYPRVTGQALASLANSKFEEAFFNKLKDYRLKGKYKGCYGHGSFYCDPERIDELRKDIEDLIVKYATDEKGQEYQYLIGMIEEPYFNFIKS